MSYDPESWTSERARLGHLVLSGAPEAEITEARRNYRALRLAETTAGALSCPTAAASRQRRHSRVRQ
jgi:hypothetical protein